MKILTIYNKLGVYKGVSWKHPYTILAKPKEIARTVVHMYYIIMFW